MAVREVSVNISVRPRWLVRQGKVGTVVAWVALKCGVPFGWMFRLRVANGQPLA